MPEFQVPPLNSLLQFSVIQAKLQPLLNVSAAILSSLRHDKHFPRSKPYNATTAVITCHHKLSLGPAAKRQLAQHSEVRSKLLVMESKPDNNVFREVHRKVREVRDKAREVRDEAARRSQRIAEDEAKKESFDRPSVLPPSEDGSQ